MLRVEFTINESDGEYRALKLLARKGYRNSSSTVREILSLAVQDKELSLALSVNPEVMEKARIAMI